MRDEEKTDNKGIKSALYVLLIQYYSRNDYHYLLEKQIHKF